jgi:hypothetical protein
MSTNLALVTAALLAVAVAVCVPRLRLYALAVLGLLLSILGAGKLGNGLKDRAQAGSNRRRDVAAARKAHKAETQERNARIDSAQAASDAAVDIADTDPSLDTIAPISEDERARRLAALGDALD